jgi:hypothetical protein
MSETAVKTNATQINIRTESRRSRCSAVDLSWALHTPVEELLAGHPNDPSEYPLRSLARYVTVTDEGLPISGRTLAKVLQGTKDLRDHDMRYHGSKSWEIQFERHTISDTTVLLRIFMKHVNMKEKQDSSEDQLEERTLALRLRVTPDPFSKLDGGVVSNICCSLECFNVMHAIVEEDVDGFRKVFGLGEATARTASCVIASYPWKVSTRY